MTANGANMPRCLQRGALFDFLPDQSVPSIAVSNDFNGLMDA